MLAPPTRLLANPNTGTSTFQSVSEEEIQNKLKQMTLKQKVGQLFIFGFIGTSLNSKIKKLLTQNTPGGLLVFKRNISSNYKMAQLNDQFQKISQQKVSLPFFIMTDQEGGSVSRIKLKSTPPSALAIGQSNNLLISHQYGVLTGELLSLMGFNVNLAPVADLSDPYKKNFIGNRSFGKSPHRVSEFALSFSKGLLSQKILPTFKHFPGHGNIDQDSHKSLPIKKLNLYDLKHSDLIPFSRLAESEFPSFIMTSHVAFPNIDKSQLPATYSKTLITSILRNDLKYTGLIITDDIQMMGTHAIGTFEQRVLKAFLAGNDMIMIAWSPQKQQLAIETLVKAVKEKVISESRLNESLTRILKYKLSLTPFQLSTKQNFYTQFQVLQNKFSQITKDVSYFNLKKSQQVRYKIIKNKPLLVFSSNRTVYTDLKRHHAEPIVYKKLSPKSSNIKNLMKKYPSSDVIYYISGHGTAEILNSLNQQLKKRIHVINSMYPGILNNPNQYKSVLYLNHQYYLLGSWFQTHYFQIQKRNYSSIENVQKTP